MIRSAIVQMRQGDFKPALKSATSSTKAARQSREKRLVAESLLVLGEVQGRSGSYATAVKTAQQAAEMFRALGDPSGEGRANWVAAMALHQLGRTKEAHSAAQRALELCSRAGDRYGVGNALILSSHTEPDFAQAYRSIRQATQAFVRMDSTCFCHASSEVCAARPRKLARTSRTSAILRAAIA